VKALLRRIIGNTSPVRLAYHRTKGLAAGARYAFPARGMRVIGVTGTNGKTTTATFIASMLAASGRKVAMATTIQFRLGDQVWTNETHKTTLSPFALQKFLAKAKKEGCQDLVLEVSSHALMQGRVLGIPFHTAVFTNLTPEHLDYHRTMAEYQAAKERLFRKLRRDPERIAVVNGDDPAARAFLRHAGGDAWVTHVEGGVATPLGDLPHAPRITRLDAVQVATESNATHFTLAWNDARLPVSMQLLGRFNVENAALATAAALANGVAPEIVARVLAEVPVIPGRLEPVDIGQPFRALIDYAVTPDSLEKLYRTLRPITQGRIIAVLGSCGDRDRGKRPVMGKVAAMEADIAIITNEEPYSEDPRSIIDAIVRGVRETDRVEGEQFFVIEDRREAIQYAVDLAAPGDTVVVSGMGNQTSMVWGERVLPWSDREVLRECLLKRDGRAA